MTHAISRCTVERLGEDYMILSNNTHFRAGSRAIQFPSSRLATATMEGIVP
jgi:hypothetical protein